MSNDSLIEDPDGRLLGGAPGLPDEAFENDGLMTKRHIRSTALAHLRPLPGQLLWDLGIGAGSIAVEWCRAAAGARAIGIEKDEERAARAERNAKRLTAPGVIQVVRGLILESLAGLPRPDAIFIGGGGNEEVVERCVENLPPGGRLVAHGVTIEAELLCVAGKNRWGGDLHRVQVETAKPLGRLTGWQPARTVIQWSLQLPAS